jgi:hypothetical protein
MLISHELEARILNLHILLKQLDVTELQRGQLRRLLGSAETELLAIYQDQQLAEIVSLYSRANHEVAGACGSEQIAIPPRETYLLKR